MRSVACEQAKKEFTARAGRLRKQKQREARDEAYLSSVNPDMESAQVQILGLIVDRNPTCFGAGTRATAACLRQHRPQGEEDAAACELAGVPAEECTISVG
ncbi:hypothetical protein [Streptomyces sp. NPDC001980]|uniref:hypothetical protein n=1 Tax=Streptomyces sp. NPDC001980 TaxID=3157126 RepID=UPI003328051F